MLMFAWLKEAPCRISTKKQESYYRVSVWKFSVVFMGNNRARKMLINETCPSFVTDKENKE